MNVLDNIINVDQYVFEGVQVKMTGRTASKPGRSGASITLVEITPSDPDITWKKWVNPLVLFKIDKACSNEKS